MRHPTKDHRHPTDDWTSNEVDCPARAGLGRVVVGMLFVYLVITIGFASSTALKDPASRRAPLDLAVVITPLDRDILAISDTMISRPGDGSQVLMRWLPASITQSGSTSPAARRVINAVSLDGRDLPWLSRTDGRHFYVWPQLNRDDLARNNHELHVSYNLEGAIQRDGSLRNFILNLGHFGARAKLTGVEVRLVITDPSARIQPSLELLTIHPTSGTIRTPGHQQHNSVAASLSGQQADQHFGDLIVVGSWVELGKTAGL